MFLKGDLCRDRIRDGMRHAIYPPTLIQLGKVYPGRGWLVNSKRRGFGIALACSVDLLVNFTGRAKPCVSIALKSEALTMLPVTLKQRTRSCVKGRL